MVWLPGPTSAVPPRWGRHAAVSLMAHTLSPCSAFLQQVGSRARGSAVETREDGHAP